MDDDEEDDGTHTGLATDMDSYIAREELTSREMDTAFALCRVKVGSRVSVYWKDEKEYFDATVKQLDPKRRAQGYLLDYDYGGREWLDLSQHKFHLVPLATSSLDSNDSEHQASNKNRTTALHKGKKNSLGDKSITDSHGENGKKLPPAEVNIPLNDKKSQMLSNGEVASHMNGDPSLVSVGTRVKIWWPEDDAFYEATIVRMRKNDPSPFYLEFEDGEREWLDLNELKFQILADESDDGMDDDEEVEDLEEPEDVHSPEESEGQVSTTPKRKAALTDAQLFTESTVAEPVTSPKTRSATSVEAEAGDSHTKSRKEQNKVSSAKISRKASVERTKQKRKQSSKRGGTKRSLNRDSESESDEEEEFVDNEAQPDPTEDAEDVVIGSKIGIWWPDDHTYYSATVEEYRPRRLPFRVLYDDGEEEWINLHKQIIKFLPDSKRRRKQLTDRQIKRLVSQLSIGTRVGIWWGGNKEYFKGTVKKIRMGDTGKPYYVVYDDGDEEWLDLASTEFYILDEERESADDESESVADEAVKVATKRRGRPPKDNEDPDTKNSPKAEEVQAAENLISSIEVGTRIAIFWEGESQFFDGTITKIKSGKKKGFFIEYDDGDSEWTDLSTEQYRILPPKRKRGRPPKNQVEGSNKRSKVNDESAVRTKKRGSPSKRGTVSTEDQSGTDVNVKRAGPGRKPKPTPPIEQLCMKTGDVLAEFKSVADARVHVGANQGCSLGAVADGRSQSAVGFFWRWKGSTNLPESLEGMTKVIHVSRVALGAPVREFETAEAAAQWAETDVKSIRRWCREHDVQKGFHWHYDFRIKTEDEMHIGRRIRIHLQSQKNTWEEGVVLTFDKSNGKHEIQLDNGDCEWVDLTRAICQFRSDTGDEPVEQICLKTGKVLATFPNATKAAESVNTKAARILPVLHCRAPSSYGYFWRFVGSGVTPPQINSRSTN